MLAWLKALAAPGWTAWLGAFAAATLLLLATGLILRQLARLLAGRPARRRPRAELDLLRDERRDPLTGLLSRRSFYQKLEARLRAGGHTALLLIDLDRFAAVNKAYGHDVGDQVLAACADRLRTLVPGGQALGRLGGDQFAVMMDAGDAAAAEASALRLMRPLMTKLHVGLHTLECSASLGVALAPDHGGDAETLLQAALHVLADVKAAGGGAWRVFDPRLLEEERRVAELGEALYAAVEAAQIVPYYLPIVDLQTGAIAGLEVLARWAHPTMGLLAPAAFIPLAESLHLAGQISVILLRRVIADARHWPPHLHFAFNTSPGQLRELIALLRDPPAWPEGSLDPHRLEVEITGSAIIEDIVVAREVIGLLQAQGARVVLDDFGIGTPNFLHMRELQFDRLKIDRSFVMGLEHNERAQACVAAMAALTRQLGVGLAAEGIETREAETFLTGLGCTHGQGFLFSEAVPGREVQALLRRHAAGRTSTRLAQGGVPGARLQASPSGETQGGPAYPVALAG